MYTTNEEFDTYITRVNDRFEALTGKIQKLNLKVETLTVQVQRMAEALKLELPNTSDERESEPKAQR